MLNKELKYSYNDVAIMPAIVSDIEHRSECNPYDNNGFLPIFAAPMSTVINEKNFSYFESNKITPILPRNIDLNKRIEYSLNGKWAAFSLKEFEEIWCNENEKYDANPFVLIDVANGHMKKIYDLVIKSKIIHSNSITIMVGNIANPLTYRYAAESGVDYIRCTIGNGDGCITSTNTGVNFPQASLIDEIAKIKSSLETNGFKKLPRIIADGGIRNYSDVIKALALGADYVMIGGVFAKAIESASPCKLMKNFQEFDEYDGLELMTTDSFENKGDGNFVLDGKSVVFYKLFYGMASKNGQKDMNTEDKTPEGITKMFKAEYTLFEWVTKMKDYLTSAMSYCNAKTLDDMKKATLNIVSCSAYNCVNR